MIVIRLLFLMVLAFVINLAFGFNESDMKHMMPEICDNAVDDDLDGLIDLNDDDCECVVVKPESLIPNPSFEDMRCCPSGRSQLSCSDIWIQASAPTTDYIHTCDWKGWEEFPAPEPFPDGDAIMGFRDGRQRSGGLTDELDEPEFNWKEYAGACLLSPLKANDAYRFEFFLGFVDSQKSPSIDITFFGTTDCDNLPFGGGDDSFGCPTNGANWIRLGSSRMSARGANSWVKGTIDVTPADDINAIVIGPACPRTSASINTYYFFDKLVLADTRSFEFVISEVNHPCAEDFRLSIPYESNRSYQWYKNGIALLNETSSELSSIYGNGDYQVRVLSDGSCTLVEAYTYSIPVIEETIRPIICEDGSYSFGSEIIEREGTYIDTFKTQFNCDSIVTLLLDVEEPVFDSLNAKIFEGEVFQVEDFSFTSSGNHKLNLQSQVGCDSIVYLNLEYYQLFFPTAFSPNGDGVNDMFTVNGDQDLIEITDLFIFDRWGNEIYSQEGLDLDTGWDGKHLDQPATVGHYVYRTTVVMDDGLKRSFSGVVALIR